MKKLFVLACAVVLIGGVALADTISTSAANTLVAFPAGFAANTSVGNTPYWNNLSQDGTGFNVGYYLSDTGAFTVGGNPGLAPTNYLTTVANSNAMPSDFSFLRGASTMNVTILYQNAGNNSGAFGTAIGIYDVSNPANKIQIFASGTIPSSVGGSGVNVNTAGIGGSGLYGFYATTCQVAAVGANCYTFYSDASLNPSVTNIGSGTVVESAGTHQHFALFTTGDPGTFYLGYEDSVQTGVFTGVLGTEKDGDYNDVIIKLTSTIPEPGTLAIVSLGLLALGFGAKRKVRG